MKLYEIIEKMDESENIIILDSNDRELARYDGRDSIPAEYMPENVQYIYTRTEDKKTYICIQLYYY